MSPKDYSKNPTIMFCTVAPGYYIEVKAITDTDVYFKVDKKMHRAKLQKRVTGGCFFKWMDSIIPID